MNQEPTRTAKAWLDHAFRCVFVAGACVTACGDSRPKGVEVEDLGVECGGARLVVAGSVEIDDATTDCQGVCLHGEAVAPAGTTSAGECSCRCDGPERAGPFCACSAGYSCEQQVRELGLGENDLAGSYCVARL